MYHPSSRIVSWKFDWRSRSRRCTLSFRRPPAPGVVTLYLSSSSSSSSAGSTSRTTFAFAPPEVRGRLTPAARMGRWFLRRAAAASGAMVYPPLRLRRASRRAARASRASSASFMRASVRFLSSSFGSPPSLCGRDGDGTVEWGEVSGGGWLIRRRREEGRGRRARGRRAPESHAYPVSEEVFSRRARKRDGRRPPFYPPLRAGLGHRVRCLGGGRRGSGRCSRSDLRDGERSVGGRTVMR